MSTSPFSHWKHLERRPGSAYRQLFIKGTRIRAEVLYFHTRDEDEPPTPEQIADDFNLPLEAVKEAIAYCRANPEVLEQDFRGEEALMEATGMNAPPYKYNPKPKPLTPQERQRLRHQEVPLPADLRTASGVEVRRACREEQLLRPTPGMALGFVQANLVIVPRDVAFDFLLFCQRNPKPCPLLDVTETGSAEPAFVAPQADLRTDLPRYCVYKQGELIDEPTNLHGSWQPDMVGFLLGCSFTFENALLQGGVPVRHVEAGCNVPMYRTNIPCRPAGIFRGPMVVSMRPMVPKQIIDAIRICSRFPRAHGVPIHFGDPAAIGIRDIHKPDFGDPVEIRPGEVPVFWACGVTPQAVVMEARPPLVITHKPGHMFVTDLRDVDLEGESSP